MKGWIELASDVNWQDYHGMWAKKAKDGSWYVLQWTNMVDACGRDATYAYECQVKRLDLAALSPDKRDSALKSCGWEITAEGSLVEPYRGVTVCDAAAAEIGIVECCIQYGFGAPLTAFTGDHYPERIRAKARRYALECMKDAEMLEEKLAQPVNMIGTSAENYGLGDLTSAPQPTVRILKQSDLLKCPFAIMVPEHYREDGTCKCNDRAHRQMMIRKWEYKKEDFKDIPLAE